MKQAKTIDEVLDQLDHIIEETLSKNSYAGIFAYVYRRTTAQIKVAVQKKQFDDNERMEKMDVIFANYYINAFENYKKNVPISSSWKASFDLQMKPLTSIQHLLLGMNAHINLDLGQAAAIVSDGHQIDDLKNDFMVVNKVLAGLVDELQLKLGKISPLMVLLDWVGKRTDELLVNFSMVKAREQAWRLATELATLNDNNERNERIEIADNNVTSLSKIVVAPPGKILKYIMHVVAMFEEKNVSKIIERLSED